MNIRTVLAGAALAFGMACAAASANAGTINWTLSGVTFQDGGVATGAFSTDDTSGELTAFDITTSGGSILAGFHYDLTTSSIFANNAFTPNSFTIAANNFSLSPYINLAFVNPLTSPGVDNLTFGIDNLHVTGSWECGDCNPYRAIVAGSAVSGGIPEPAAWAMMLMGFAGVGGALRMSRREAVTA